MFLFPSETITYLSKSLVPVLITKSKYQNSWNIGRHNCSWFIKTLPKFFFCQINWKTQIICFSASLSPFCNSGNRRHLAADWSTLPKFPSHQKVRLTNNNFSGFFSDSVFSCEHSLVGKAKWESFANFFLKKIRNSSKMKACMLTYLCIACNAGLAMFVVQILKENGAVWHGLVLIRDQKYKDSLEYET